MADSSTGGFLLPVKPVETAESFEDTIHDFIAGLTGLPGSMVRPKFKRKAAGLPEPGVDWCSFGIVEEGNGEISGERHFGEGEGHSIAAVHEPFVVLVSFYGDRSRDNALAFRLGLGVAQNREYLYKHEMALVSIGPSVSVPEIIGEVWNDRCDIRVTFRRRITNEYNVLNVKEFMFKFRTK